MHSNERSLVGEVDDVELAAVLVALGFEVLGARVVKDHDTTSRGHGRADLGVWRFSRASKDGVFDFDGVRERWGAALRGGAGVGRVLFCARLALHNLRCLTGLVNGAPLCAVPGADHTRLVNEVAVSGGEAVLHLAALNPPSVLVRSSEACAAGLAVGCRLVSYHCMPDGVCFGMTRGASEWEPGTVEALRRDLTWVQEPGNMSPLAVSIATLCNRRTLISGVRKRAEMHLVRSGDSALYLPACADERMVARGAQLMNI